MALLSNKPRATTEEKNNHQIVYITLRGQIDRMEEFAESIHLSSPAIDLMQAHVNLFHKFVGPSKLSEVIEGASAIVEKLIAHGVKSPVTHETATFVTVVLTKALDLVHGHSATITQLHRLRGWFESGVAGSAAWATPLKNCIAKKLEGVQTQVNDENTLQTQVNDENTLHNLANAAVGDLSEADSVEEIEDVDWEPCTSGYAELTG